MSEATDRTIPALLTRDPSTINPMEAHTALSSCALMVNEMMAYEDAVVAAGRDPEAAKAMLLNMRHEPTFGAVRMAVLDFIESRKAEPQPAAEAPRVDYAAELHREAAFRSDPGAWIPGAVTAPGIARLDYAMSGFLLVDGEIRPWDYCGDGVDALGCDMLLASMVAMGFSRGYVVGTRLSCDLPANLTFVEVL